MPSRAFVEYSLKNSNYFIFCSAEEKRKMTKRHKAPHGNVRRVRSTAHFDIFSLSADPRNESYYLLCSYPLFKSRLIVAAHGVRAILADLHYSVKHKLTVITSVKSNVVLFCRDFGISLKNYRISLLNYKRKHARSLGI